jgi:hypothetical protein
MDFELHPSVILHECSCNVLVAPRQHFIEMLNRNSSTAFQGSIRHKQLFRHIEPTASQVCGVRDKERFHHILNDDHIRRGSSQAHYLLNMILCCMKMPKR